MSMSDLDRFTSAGDQLPRAAGYLSELACESGGHWGGFSAAGVASVVLRDQRVVFEVNENGRLLFAYTDLMRAPETAAEKESLLVLNTCCRELEGVFLGLSREKDRIYIGTWLPFALDFKDFREIVFRLVNAAQCLEPWLSSWLAAQRPPSSAEPGNASLKIIKQLA
jgi:hypothetical protein